MGSCLNDHVLWGESVVLVAQTQSMIDAVALATHCVVYVSEIEATPAMTTGELENKDISFTIWAGDDAIVTTLAKGVIRAFPENVSG